MRWTDETRVSRRRCEDGLFSTIGLGFHDFCSLAVYYDLSLLLRSIFSCKKYHHQLHLPSPAALSSPGPHLLPSGFPLSNVHLLPSPPSFPSPRRVPTRTPPFLPSLPFTTRMQRASAVGSSSSSSPQRNLNSQPSSYSTTPLPPGLPRPANPEGLTFSSDYEDPLALPLHHNAHPRRTQGPGQNQFQQQSSTSSEMEVHTDPAAARRRGGGGVGVTGAQVSEKGGVEGGDGGEKSAYGAGAGAGGKVGGAGGGRRDRPAYRPPSKTWVSPVLRSCFSLFVV